MSIKALPLCSTCEYHQIHTRKINIMWGAGLVCGAVIGPLTLGIIIALIFNNSNAIDENRVETDAAIEQTRKVVSRNERTVNDGLHKLERTLTVMSINQMRQMRESGIEYIDPYAEHSETNQ